MPGQGKSLLISEIGVTVIVLPLVSREENKKANTRKPQKPKPPVCKY